MSARYHAPAVAYDFERPFWVMVVLWASGMLLLAALLGWCLQFQGGGIQVLLSITVWMFAVLLLSLQWHVWPRGRLLWDGEHWTLMVTYPSRGPMEPVQVGVGFDGGGWLWLRVTPVSEVKAHRWWSRGVWIFLSRQSGPEQWGELRRAVYSSIVLQTE